MIDLILQLLLFVVNKSSSLSAEKKRIFYDFIEKYNGDHSSDNAKEKINTEEQIKDLSNKK